MLAVLLVVHIIACVALVIAVMLQRSEGGALGMGGGGTGGIISGRGVANVLVRTTMGLAAVFFVTSIVMTRLNTEAARTPNAVERELKNRKTDAFAPTKEPTSAPATTPEPAAPAPDPLAAPSLTSPPATSTAPVTTSEPAATPAPGNAAPAKPKAAEPVAPATKPASPDTAPATPAPAGNDTNGQ
ncbi:MAG: preprotein translocase subunit SecG [Alphaproteobacteria bacterium]|nr:preprotein translocase subunit SecG [Alphaproteobacteria bacterium]